MAILHGNWLTKNQTKYLFIWGETWRRINPSDNLLSALSENILSHPFGMNTQELITFLADLQNSGQLKWQLPEKFIGKNTKTKTKKSQDQEIFNNIPKLTIKIALLTQISTKNQEIIPIHSAAEIEENNEDLYLYPWQVEGIYLETLEALNFLQALPLGNITQESFIGSDLSFWSQIDRWSLDLLARSKFLPDLSTKTTNQEIINTAIWQPLLDSAVDQNRLEKFAKKMPVVCRMYQQDDNLYINSNINSPIYIELPPKPQQLLREVLSIAIDTRIRNLAAETTLEPKILASLKPVMRQWLQALSNKQDNILNIEKEAVENLATALKVWTAPLQEYLDTENIFRTCFHLHIPTPGKTEWLLEYCLQAADDSELVIDAETIWNNPFESIEYRGRNIQNPQETLLKGLGLAARLFPILENSLNTPRPVFCRLNAIEAYDFIKSAVWRFIDSGLGVILPASLTNREAIASRLGLSIRAETPKLKKQDKLGLQSLLNFQWELSIGGQKISKPEFDKLVALNSPLVEINGEWVELRPSDIRAAQNFFTSRKDKLSLSLEDALRLSTGDTQTIEKLPVVSFEASGALEELLNTLTNNHSLEEIKTPVNFRGELRPYQAKGVSWLNFLQRWSLGACLADDMGLGKTIQFIAFLLHLQEKKELESPVLLICPTSVLGNWEREVKKFGPKLKVMVHHGDKRAKNKAFASVVADKNLVITSYALVYRDLKDLQSIAWQGIVLDEAQNIKNSDAKQSQAVRQIETSFRIALTGTPVENRLTELWSILDFLNPGYLGPKNFFQRRFAIPIEKYGDTDSLHILRSLVRPFILRRLKTDKTIIQDLPEKQEMTVFCGLASSQAALYQQIVETSLAEIESSAGIQRRGMILALLIKLKQICNHPLLLKEDGKIKPGEINSKESGKLQRLQEMLEEVLAEGDRALIFTQFAEWGKLLKPYLEKQLNREILFLYGSTSKQQREDMIDRFQNDPQGPPIMILSLKAGGTGLNLTRATHVFHFDRWWNPAVENQATDRVFRIGQKRNVQVHKFVTSGTLEEKIHDLIESKKALAEQVVGAGENWLTELDTDQLRNLLLLDRNAVIDDE